MGFVLLRCWQRKWHRAKFNFLKILQLRASRFPGCRQQSRKCTVPKPTASLEAKSQINVHRWSITKDTSASFPNHTSDATMSAMASQITCVLILSSTICSGTDQTKIKAPRHWPLWGKYAGDRWIPRTKASNAEYVSTWWRLHVGNIGHGTCHKGQRGSRWKKTQFGDSNLWPV